MVTQDGSLITIPPTETLLSSAEAHSVTMLSEDGTEGQVCGLLDIINFKHLSFFIHNVILTAVLDVSM